MPRSHDRGRLDVLVNNAATEASFVTGVVWVVDGGAGISRGLPGRRGDIAAPPLTLPVRHPLEGFDHPGATPGER